MPRRRRTVGRRSEIKDWMVTYCLDGIEPSEGVNRFEALSFCQSFPYESAARRAGGSAWFEVWDAIKDTDEVKRWREAHRGKPPYAEQRLQQMRRKS